MKKIRLVSLTLMCLQILSTGINAQPPQRQAAIKTFSNIVYGNLGGVKETMDIYSPTNGAVKHACIVLIHGGAWISGNKAFYTGFARQLASHGYVAASINYRMLPKWHYPAELDDAQLAVRYLRANAAGYDIDPARFGALGDSAGGYLVAMLVLCGTRDKAMPLSKFSSRVQAVVDFYGPTDFMATPSDGGIAQGGLSLLSMFLHGSRTSIPDVYKSSSPITYVSANAAPFLIIHGSADELIPVSQSVRLASGLNAHKLNDATMLEVMAAPHGFLDGNHPGIFEAMAAKFFDEHLNQ